MIQQYILFFDSSTNPATNPITAIGHTINAHPLSNPAEDHPAVAAPTSSSPKVAQCQAISALCVAISFFTSIRPSSTFPLSPYLGKSSPWISSRSRMTRDSCSHSRFALNSVSIPCKGPSKPRRGNYSVSTQYRLRRLQHPFFISCAVFFDYALEKNSPPFALPCFPCDL